jgi:O-glycosyl hydrolase
MHITRKPGLPAGAVMAVASVTTLMMAVPASTVSANTVASRPAGAAQAGTVDVTVNPGQLHQRIDGFGAAT